MNILFNSRKNFYFSGRFLENEHLSGREISHHIIVTTIVTDTPNLNKKYNVLQVSFSSSKKITGRKFRYV